MWTGDPPDHDAPWHTSGRKHLAFFVTQFLSELYQKAGWHCAVYQLHKERSSQSRPALEVQRLSARGWGLTVPGESGILITPSLPDRLQAGLPCTGTLGQGCWLLIS